MLIKFVHAANLVNIRTENKGCILGINVYNLTNISINMGNIHNDRLQYIMNCKILKSAQQNRIRVNKLLYISNLY